MFPVKVRSVEWRYGEEQIAMTDERLPAMELLSVESDLVDNIHVYFSDIVDIFGIATSRKCQ